MKSPNTFASPTGTQHQKTAQDHQPLSPSSDENWERSEGMFAGKSSLGRILIIDDDPDVRKLIRIILENFGYDVLAAGDGQQAINLLTSGETPLMVDTIITDLSMPNVNDGSEAITFFLQEFPRIPIIILTGISDMDLATAFMQKGIGHYLVKPVDVRQLLASVGQAIGQR